MAYLPADIDHRFARQNLPDHGDLLANVIRWALNDQLPLRVSGRGLVDAQLYRQPKRLALHLVNLNNAGTWRTPVHELIPVGSLSVSVCVMGKSDADTQVRSLVSDNGEQATRRDQWVDFTVGTILDHDVFVIE